MQLSLDLGAASELAFMRESLVGAQGAPSEPPLREPIGQLVKSMISNQTLDAVSLRTYEGLITIYPQWRALADAPPQDVETVIAEVTFAEKKARHLHAALAMIASTHPDFGLRFLAEPPVPRALAWLERLPGVGRKVSASTLNFSTLHRPAFVVDSHVLRVLRRFGLVHAKAATEAAYEAVMAAVPEWSAAELRALHGLLKRLGQTVCRRNRPHCQSCPIRDRCRTGARMMRGAPPQGVIS